METFCWEVTKKHRVSQTPPLIPAPPPAPTPHVPEKQYLLKAFLNTCPCKPSVINHIPRLHCLFMTTALTSCVLHQLTYFAHPPRAPTPGPPPLPPPGST